MNLLCEGDERSPDAPILRAILAGLPVVVRPSKSRGALLGGPGGPSGPASSGGNPGSAAIRDGDFPDTLDGWFADPTPRRWLVAGEPRGWIWRRKEIENYVVDPEVLARTFGWSDADRGRYGALMEVLLDATAERTAARMALVGLLPRFERRVVKPFDPVLRGDALMAALRERHRRAEATPRFSEEELLRRFVSFRELFAPGGPGRHPWVIAGKDLMGAIARVPDIRARFPALVEPERMIAAVVRAMAGDPACAGWVPEWAGLRAEVEAWSSMSRSGSPGPS